MPARITYAIPKQNFEVIRDQIGAILALELASQSVLDPTYQTPTVIIEGYYKIDVSNEYPIILVKFVEAKYTQNTKTSSTGIYTYMIYVYESADISGNESSDTHSMFKLEKTIGMVRSILMNPEYFDNFGLPKGIIQTKTVSQILIPEQEDPSMENAVKGVLIFDVTAGETYTLSSGDVINEIRNSVSLQGTDKGILVNVNSA